MTPAAAPARTVNGPLTTGSGADNAGGDGYFPEFTNHGSSSRSSTSGPSGGAAPEPRNSTSSETSASDAFAGGLDPVTATHVEAQAAYLAAREEQREVELGDGEVDTMISIPLPMWATPTHNVHPVFVTHKIKWSCVISNPDGHSASCPFPSLTLLSLARSLSLRSFSVFSSVGAAMCASHPRPLAPPG